MVGGVIGNQFGKGSGKVAATFAGAVIGGIVGNAIGRDLDARDRELARQAEYDAWERGTPGRPVRWRNPDNSRYGEIVPEAYYDRGGSRCRDFVHSVWIEGRKQQMRGTACRNPDGTWTQVSWSAFRSRRSQSQRTPAGKPGPFFLAHPVATGPPCHAAAAALCRDGVRPCRSDP